MGGFGNYFTRRSDNSQTNPRANDTAHTCSSWPRNSLKQNTNTFNASSLWKYFILITLQHHLYLPMSLQSSHWHTPQGSSSSQRICHLSYSYNVTKHHTSLQRACWERLEWSLKISFILYSFVLWSHFLLVLWMRSGRTDTERSCHREPEMFHNLNIVMLPPHGESSCNEEQ